MSGNPEVFSSPVGLVPRNALVVIDGPTPGLSANRKLLSCGGNSECKLGLPESSNATSLVLASPLGHHPDHVAFVVEELQRGLVGDGQRPQHHLLYQRENRGGRPDAESESEDGYGSETGRLAKYAQTVAQVLNQRPHTVSCLYAKEHVGAMLSQETHFTPAVAPVPDGWSATLPYKIREEFRQLSVASCTA